MTALYMCNKSLGWQMGEPREAEKIEETIAKNVLNLIKTINHIANKHNKL